MSLFDKLTNGKAQMQVLYPAQIAAIGEDYQKYIEEIVDEEFIPEQIKNLSSF